MQQFNSGLYLVPSPLGNLGDLSFRAVEVLKNVDLIAAEDTRRALKLLNHLNIKCKLISYREQNHKRAWPQIAGILSDGGRVALLTDAGAPVVSDPGAELTAAAREAGFQIIPLPGPSAVITALMASGFSGGQFMFCGFVPAKTQERKKFLESFKTMPCTLIFFEAPHRLAESLAQMADIFGLRRALLAREMTKLHEELLFDDLAHLAADVAARPRKGEISIVVEAYSGEAEKHALADADIVKCALNSPLPVKVLAAQLAVESGRSRAEIYKIIVETRQSDTGNG